MTEPMISNPTTGAGPTAATGPLMGTPASAEGTAGQAVPIMPDGEVMIREIDEDRRHERYLVRAALVAVVVIAIALTIRLVWG